jgi:hypothetical protein
MNVSKYTPELSDWTIPEKWEKGLSKKQEAEAKKICEKLEKIVHRNLFANPDAGMTISRAIKIRKHQENQLAKLKVLINQNRKRGWDEQNTPSLAKLRNIQDSECDKNKVNRLLVALGVDNLNDGIIEVKSLYRRLVKAIDRAETAETIAKQHYNHRLSTLESANNDEIELLYKEMDRLKKKLRDCQQGLSNVEA